MLNIRFSKLLITLVILFAVTLSASAKDKVFVMVPKGVHPYYIPCYEGFKAAGKKFGVKTEYVAPQDFQLPNQVKVIENLIVRKVDGIALSALDNEGLINVIQQAVDAGIKVICFDADAPGSARLSYIGTNNKTAGEIGAEQMAKFMGNKGEIAVLQAGLGASNLNMRYDGFVARMADIAPEIKIVAREDTENKFELATNKTEALMSSYPKLSGIFGVSAEGAPSAAIAVEDAGKEGMLTLGGFDDLPDTIEAIKSGTVQFCLAQMTYKMGWLSVTELIKACDGKKISPEIDTGMMIITKENADSYMEQMQKETQNL